MLTFVDTVVSLLTLSKQILVALHNLIYEIEIPIHRQPNETRYFQLLTDTCSFLSVLSEVSIDNKREILRRRDFQ